MLAVREGLTLARSKGIHMIHLTLILNGCFQHTTQEEGGESTPYDVLDLLIFGNISSICMWVTFVFREVIV